MNLLERYLRVRKGVHYYFEDFVRKGGGCLIVQTLPFFSNKAIKCFFISYLRIFPVKLARLIKC